MQSIHPHKRRKTSEPGGASPMRTSKGERTKMFVDGSPLLVIRSLLLCLLHGRVLVTAIWLVHQMPGDQHGCIVAWCWGEMTSGKTEVTPYWVGSVTPTTYFKPASLQLKKKNVARIFQKEQRMKDPQVSGDGWRRTTDYVPRSTLAGHVYVVGPSHQKREWRSLGPKRGGRVQFHMLKSVLSPRWQVSFRRSWLR